MLTQDNIKNLIKKTFRVIQTPFVLADLIKYRSQDKEKRFDTNLVDLFPCIKDKTILTSFDRHYVYHTSWAARVVKEINPPYHIDISSSLYFCGIVSAFIPVKFYDYRRAEIDLSNLTSLDGDLMKLPFENDSVVSISCMHTIEHVGLGRYGDPIDPEGDIKAIKELKRVVARGGNLIIVVPMGIPKIEFNAHRIYSYEQICSYVIDKEFELKEFSYIPENSSEGGIIRNAKPEITKNAEYACGCFWFKRKND